MWEELKTMDGDERFRYIFGNIICFIWIVGLCYYAFVDSRRWRSTGLIRIIEDKRFQLQEEAAEEIKDGVEIKEDEEGNTVVEVKKNDGSVVEIIVHQ